VFHNGQIYRRDVEFARDGKEVKGAYQIKRTRRKKLCLMTRGRKGVGNINTTGISLTMAGACRLHEWVGVLY
jgi:hypothetical protein